MDSHGESATDSRIHVIIEGRVQGVGFRYYVVDAAATLDVVGWVRNTMDRNVEVVAEGTRPILVELLSYLRQGPPSSFVEKVNVSWEEPSGKLVGFRILPTTWTGNL